MKQITAIGIPASFGGNHAACAQGPIALRDSNFFTQSCLDNNIKLQWLGMLSPPPSSPHNAIESLCRQAASASFNCISMKQSFIFFSGEHSYAMGIWKGVMEAFNSTSKDVKPGNLTHKKLGLIWVDAHMDAHTFTSSPSGNVHGMPVAALLGQGDAKLKQIYGQGPSLKAENLALVGLRNFEQDEADLLARLNVKQVRMSTLSSLGIGTALLVAREHVLKHADYFAISLDIDAIDPLDAPAVGVPEPNGISGNELCQGLKQFNADPQFLGLEIAEFSPEFDQQDKTLHLITGLVTALYGTPAQ